MNKFRKPDAQHSPEQSAAPQVPSIWADPQWRAETDDRWGPQRVQDSVWRDWVYDPDTYSGPPAARGVVLEALLGHGHTEYVRPGHADWDQPGSARQVRRWRVHIR